MIKLYKISILTIAFICGILISEFFILPKIITFSLLPISILACIICKNLTIQSIFILINFLSLGHISLTFEKEKILTHKQDLNCVAYIAQIVDEEKNVANIVSVKNKCWKKLKINERIKLKTTEKFLYGDLILVQGNPRKINSKRNPFCFDYKKFLQSQNINYQQNLCICERIGNVPENYFLSKLKLYREKLRNNLQKYIKDEQARGIISAMLLGLKKDLGKNIQNIYSTTGVIHVLAVSGLHVGIIFLFINFLLQFFFKKGTKNIIKLLLTLFFLWFYVGITGFSPSVLRATLMFSIMLLCDFFSFKNQIQSSISISALLLLLFDPKIIYNLGFQLSYSAVIGIVLFQKKIKDLLHIKNRILKYCWDISSVTLSAQIFTLPLILYYFKKFPTYFIFSNLIIIPMSSCFVILGLIVILLSPINFLHKVSSYILNFVLVTVNKVITLIANLPKSSIQTIEIDFFDVIFLYSFIFCLLFFLSNEKFLRLFFITCLILIGKNFYQDYSLRKQNILIFYNVKPYWALSFIKGKRAVVIADKKMETLDYIIDNQIKPSLEHYKIVNVEYKFYDDDIRMFELDQNKICVVSRNFKNFLPCALDFNFDFLLNNSFLDDISDKIRSKEVINYSITPKIFKLDKLKY